MNSLLSVSGKALRLRRVVHAASGKCLMVPLDHSLADGPIANPQQLREIVGDVAAHGGDAIVVHKGRARFLSPDVLNDLALVVHLNGSTRYADDANAKTLFASVEDALACGADAVSVHVNLGSKTETQQLLDLSRIAAECARWSMPLLAMIYPRGPGLGDRPQAELIQHAANVAADLGADIVKLPYSGDPASMADIIAGSSLPVLVAGGAKLPEDEFVAFTTRVMKAGAMGIAAGRNVFTAPKVAPLIRRLSDAVHGVERQAAHLVA
ncbi:fructose-bisphosphate aldolase [Burkholderia sp. Bp9125]|nr:fructose-bisphosphate aldolase [Burkholderia sp. Bp9125]